MKNKISLWIWLIVLFDIFIFVNSTTANAFLVHETDKIIEKAVIENKKNSHLLNFGLNLLTGIFTIKQIGLVSAEDSNYNTTNSANATHSTSGVSWNCCLETKIGAICQDLSSDYASDCKSDSLLIPVKCDEVGECKLGCCIDNQEGTCTTNSPKAECEKTISGVAGTWKNDKSCLVEECTRGCCVLGENVEFVNEKRCERISSLQGFEKNFKADLRNEIECLALKETQELGACVINGACSLRNEIECKKNNGEFFLGKLCSHSDLITEGVKCEKQKAVGCLEGKDEIYWYDSCGNRENIYDADKDKSWNNGNILSREESCATKNADCGNCNYLLGTKCARKDGKTVLSAGNPSEYECRDLTCIDEKGKKRENGESWCVYDSYIGDGKDTVGSRHWKRLCIDGEIKVEPCADYRGEVCAEGRLEEGEKTFSTANCIINDALTCIMKYNGKEPDLKACAENPQCVVKKIDVDEGFKFDMCSSAYPRGLDLIDGTGNAGSSNDICSMANQKCIVFYEKKISGWVCVFNCDCETSKFSEQMNDLCISLGDCGSYINYIGDGTDNAKIKNAPKVSWKDYIKYAEPVEGQYVNASVSDEIIAQLGGGVPGPDGKLPEQSSKNPISMLGTVAGGLGTIIGGAVYLGGTSTANFAGVEGLTVITEGSLGEGLVNSNIACFGTMLQGAAIGAMVGGLIAKAFGLKGQAAMIMAVAGAIGGAIIGYLAFKAGVGMLAYCIGPQAIICLIILIILIIIAIILKILGIGETKKVIVEFKCLPWQPVIGGDNCDKCNDDPLKPCSEYRCSSLGKACKILNEDTTNPVCVAEVNDGKPPVIYENYTSVGFKFTDKRDDGISIRTISDECIPEFTPVIFALSTDEYAQCKIDFEKKEDYENMSDYFIEENAFTKEHTTSFMMPSISALESQYNISIVGDMREKLADLNMYIRCQDSYGNYNKKEYIVNFCIKSGKDLTPAMITVEIPRSGSVLEFGTSESPLGIFLSEPAECKWDFDKDSSYEIMTNPFECMTDLEDSGIYGWPCNTTLTNLNADENKIYIKCKDQPWLKGTANETDRNVNTESYEYKILSSRSELKIDSISPEGEISEGFEPVSIDLEMKTSGGAENGVAQCYYSFLGDEDMISFFDTFSTTHKQSFSTIMRGDYKIYLKCEDVAGNVVTGETTFSVNIDAEPPQVVRAYHSGNSLNIMTNEKAVCYYNFDRCNSEFGGNQSNEMTSTGFSTVHSANWQQGKVYYIKCKDVWGNAPGDCSIKIIPD